MCAVRTLRNSPLRYKIDDDAQLLVIEVLSTEDAPAVRAALRGIQADPRFRASLDVCVNCNTLSAVPTPEDVRLLARLCAGRPCGEEARNWALIATWQPLYDAARAFSTSVRAPKVTIRVFQAWSDARMWLSTTRTTRAITPHGAPWIGPSSALNALIRRTGLSTR